MPWRYRDGTGRPWEGDARHHHPPRRRRGNKGVSPSRLGFGFGQCLAGQSEGRADGVIPGQTTKYLKVKKTGRKKEVRIHDSELLFMDDQFKLLEVGGGGLHFAFF